MAKSAMVGLSEAMRGELAPENIGVSVFCPGPVQSNIAETGRTRPPQFSGANSGFAELERKLEQRPISPLWMEALECGERVLSGIRHNDMYIFTHREFREPMEERCRAIMAAFPDEPRNEQRAAEIHFLLANPIYREGAERKPRRM
jgi:short-subunit dehydrogenase